MGAAKVDVLDIVGDALDELGGRTSGGRITVAIEASKGKVGSRLSGRWSTTRLALTLSVASGRTEHLD